MRNVRILQIHDAHSIYDGQFEDLSELRIAYTRFYKTKGDGIRIMVREK